MTKRNARAVEVKSRDDDKLAAGAFYFVRYHDAPDVKVGMIHACPCGCGGRSALWFKGHGRGRQEWEVSGEWPNVTLSPSIGIRAGGDGTVGADGFHWHGYLRNGVFEEL